MSLQAIQDAQTLQINDEFINLTLERLASSWLIPVELFNADHVKIKEMLVSRIKAIPNNSDYTPTQKEINQEFELYKTERVNWFFERFKNSEIENAHKNHTNEYQTQLEDYCKFNGSSSSVILLKAFPDGRTSGEIKRDIELLLHIDHNYDVVQTALNALEAAKQELLAELEIENQLEATKERIRLGGEIIAMFSYMNASANLPPDQSAALLGELAPIKGLLESGALDSAKALIEALPVDAIITQEKKNAVLGMFP